MSETLTRAANLMRVEALREAPGFAEHAAAWHPAVALAVADWLTSTADQITERNKFWATWDPAFSVARAYLCAAESQEDA